MNAYPHILLLGSLGPPWPKKGAHWLVACAHSQAPATTHCNKYQLHTSAARCTPCTKWKRSEFMTRAQVCCARRNFIRIAECTFLWQWFLSLGRSGVWRQQWAAARPANVMAGSTLCARDTNHYDAIKLCRADFSCSFRIYRLLLFFSSLLPQPESCLNLFRGTIDTRACVSWCKNVRKWKWSEFLLALVSLLVAFFTFKICRCGID